MRNRKPLPPSMEDQDDWPIDQGRPWLLRLLALLGALGFVMLGVNSLLPAFEPPSPRPMPDQRNRSIT
ncbi:hypothetical protein KBY74_06390 [Cyanobium sp. A1C-AMD]|jgi:hypothetical protein|uniref:hypothetical protein n=1 Tax=unclassified Cyanobium TaxID=2627006 RepID=UPI0020CE5A99|nr:MULTISPECIES: hypothetical protein [unclassified Cyanobium]MCP9822568.1 hypothetical protein [Cyanobium sp. L1E-Cus]MCP9879487.1 hypothetical protein [Cyanobium sp. A1C-AMD]